jgi:hypothetical protein
MTTVYCLRFEIAPTWRPGPRIYILRNRVAQLYAQELDSLSVAFYDSQAKVEVIRTLLHTLEGQSAIT